MYSHGTSGKLLLLAAAHNLLSPSRRRAASAARIAAHPTGRPLCPPALLNSTAQAWTR